MLAELLENAASFSPAQAPVEVVVRPGTDVTTDGGALVEVIDHGLGMSAERLREENARLIRRERLDLVPTKVLGLFVVGSLARRWGVRVTLSRTPGGGVTGTVWIPATLLVDEVSDVPGVPDEAEGSTPSLAVAAPERRPTPPEPPESPPASPPATQSSGGPRPLRRRVRGATLARTTPPADRETLTARRPADADAVRSELDELESAVQRAEQDSAPPAPPAPPAPSQQPQEPKESGSDHADR
jgi:hypothetical protein